MSVRSLVAQKMAHSGQRGAVLCPFLGVSQSLFSNCPPYFSPCIEIQKSSSSHFSHLFIEAKSIYNFAKLQTQESLWEEFGFFSKKTSTERTNLVHADYGKTIEYRSRRALMRGDFLDITACIAWWRCVRGCVQLRAVRGGRREAPTKMVRWEAAKTTMDCLAASGASQRDVQPKSLLCCRSACTWSWIR